MSKKPENFSSNGFKRNLILPFLKFKLSPRKLDLLKKLSSSPTASILISSFSLLKYEKLIGIVPYESEKKLFVSFSIDSPTKLIFPLIESFNIRL